MPLETWMDNALCARPEHATLPWFPNPGDVVTECLKVCARCPVRRRCLDFAMAAPQRRDHGIWGGTMPGERKRAAPTAA